MESLEEKRRDAQSLYNEGQVQEAAEMLQAVYENNCSYYKLSKLTDRELNAGLWMISDLMLYKLKASKELYCLRLNDDVYNSFMVSAPERHKPKVDSAIKYNATQCKASLDSRFKAPEPCPVKGYEDLWAVPESWRKSKIYFEIPCIGEYQNSRLGVGMDRDGPKYRPEGMNNIYRLKVLTIAQVDVVGYSESGEEKMDYSYELDQLFLNYKQPFWGRLSFDYYFGETPGALYFNGGSSPLNGGSGRNIVRLLVDLDYPFSAKVTETQSHPYK